MPVAQGFKGNMGLDVPQILREMPERGEVCRARSEQVNTDFRVAVDFFTHHKARKLKKRLGAAAVLSLLQLWAYAAKLRTDGNLSGMSVEDIELAAEWDGDEGAFSAALLDVGFLDQGEDGYSLHDWAGKRVDLLRRGQEGAAGYESS